MKIAVATNNKETVAGHVGKCRAFLIYEIEDKKIKRIEYRENTFTNHGRGSHDHNHEHGYGHGMGHGHGHLVEGLQDCSSLIFKSGGWRMIENLQENNIQPIITDEKSADTAVEKFIKGELEEKDLEDCHDHNH